MTFLSGGLVRARSLPRRSASLIWRYVTGRVSTRDVLSIAMRVSRFARWGVRPVTQRRLNGLVAAAALVAASQAEAAASRVAAAASQAEAAASHAEAAELHQEVETTRRALREAVELRRRLDATTDTIAHLRRVEAAYGKLSAPAGVQAFVDRLQSILFNVHDTTPQSRAAATLLLDNQPPDNVIATLVNLSEPAHGARSFQYMVPFLAHSGPFPLPWPDGATALRIVDVGSQELTFETDVHAPLRFVAPMEVIGFDPFTQPSEGPDGAVEVYRPDGRTIRTYPYLIADGGMVKFHINRFDPTSSTLPSNHALAHPFGLLDPSLETVETRELQSRRLDDVLANDVPVDLLKIDVQGAAHTVLDHARALLKQTLVCHVEAEFAPVYKGERLFADIDILLREAGFAFVDFYSLGRQRYACFDASGTRGFHRGRTLWADCLYLRGLDNPDGLTSEELFRAALIMHVCYNKQDLAAELLGRSDALTGGTSRSAYISGLTPENVA